MKAYMGTDSGILALDLATKTGWCAKGASGIQTFDVKRGESPGMRFLRCRAWLNEMLGLLPGLKILYYEQAHHRGGYATEVGVGLVTEVKAFAAQHGLEVSPIHTATLKKWATGNGRASKEEMIKEAQARGYDPQDDNEADAMLLYEFAVADLGG
uniref:Holliday junction resolvase RuvC n=2 Tax=viral metagenome TaxID=1070528 RepID=A0A6H1ZAN6_9ZZZZ